MEKNEQITIGEAAMRMVWHGIGNHLQLVQYGFIGLCKCVLCVQ